MKKMSFLALDRILSFKHMDYKKNTSVA